MAKYRSAYVKTRGNQHEHSGDPRIVRHMISQEDNEAFLQGLYDLTRKCRARHSSAMKSNAYLHVNA